MDRRRFLIVSAAVSGAAAAPRALFAAQDAVATVRVVRGPRQVMLGTPGRCAGSRRNGFDLERMLRVGR